ncbi:MAG: PD40 domain-containing protein, partial [Planctomycetes bacterium]|nr:PD40 domain-containing protein [Planctomycetota bacterium]
MTPDGAFIAFTSRASDLAKHDHPPLDVFLWERATDAVTRISNGLGGASGNGDSDCPSLSRDGRLVAFRSYAKNLVAVDVNKEVDAFVYDRATGTMRLASLDDQGNQP